MTIHIVYGPQGSGKSAHAHRIMSALKAERLVDDWSRRFRSRKLLPGDLALTNDDLDGKSINGVRILHIDDVLLLLDCG